MVWLGLKFGLVSTQSKCRGRYRIGQEIEIGIELGVGVMLEIGLVYIYGKG
jgi:hypothetical protein